MIRVLFLLLFPTLAFAGGLEKPAPGQFPHGLFNQVLAMYVDGAGKVDYKSLQGDSATLDQYLAYVALTSPARDPEIFPTREDQLAYWLNAYNALAIAAVVRSPGLHAVNDNLVKFFYGTKYVVGGKKLSLYKIENGVVRPGFQDPRVHFALNCQSGGCPRLQQEAYDPARLQVQLDTGAKEFVANPAKVFRDEAGTWHISQIFEWYKEDFAAQGGPVGFIDAHGGSIPADAKVEIIPYDWTLSAQAGRAP